MKKIGVALGCLWLLSGCITTIDGKKPPKPKPKAAAKSYMELGVAYMKRGRYDMAEPKLQRSVELSPTPEAYNALALLYEETHNNLLAEATYKRLLELFPDYPRGYLNYNIFLCKYDRVHQIADLASKMAKKSNEIAAIGKIAAGNCALSKGDEALAESHYLGALQHEKYAAGALLPLAEINLHKGFVKEAKTYVDTVNNYIGYSAQSLYLAAIIAKELGNPIAARKMIRELKNRFPQSAEASRLTLE